MTIDAAALVAMVLKSPGVEELVDTIAADENPVCCSRSQTRIPVVGTVSQHPVHP